MTNIFKALACFQQECPVIHKGTKGYGYSYADLPAIFSTINPLLKKNGLGFTQLVQENAIETILFHIESGETIKSMTTIPEGVQLKGMNEFQVAGSAITYYRRYALSSLLGIITDKDTDAGGEQTKKATPTDKPWLNKGTDEFKQALDYIKKGGKVESIQAKYKISKEVKELLIK